MSKHQADGQARPPLHNPLPHAGEGTNESRSESCSLWDGTRHTLGMDEMDNTHREFIEQVEMLINASNSDFPALFQALLNHTREHFTREGKLMRASNYKGLPEHES